MTKIVFTTGAGISVPSGIAPYRGTGGIYTENPGLEQMLTIANYRKDRLKVIAEIDKVRKQLSDKKPNRAHYAIAELEKTFDVTVITQNIDFLHTTAGSTNVLELHGNIYTSKLDENGQPRPTAVLFGELLPEDVYNKALEAVSTADVVIAVGTSGNVAPASYLMDIGNDRAHMEKIPFYYLSIDPPETYLPFAIFHFGSAEKTVPKLCYQLINAANGIATN